MSKELSTIFGNNLRERRKELKLTQSELATKIGISTSFYANIERGNRFVSLEVLNRLANALNISIGRLFEKHKSNETLENINDMLRMCSQEDLKTVENILEAIIVSLMQSKENSNNKK